jgi:hypothetical protein
MRRFVGLILGSLLLIGAAPLSSQASDLSVRFSSVGHEGYLHPSLVYFQLEFSGTAISTSTNCASFLSSQGNLSATLRVPGKPNEVRVNLSTALKKTVSISRTSLICDFFVEGWGRSLFYQAPIGDIYGGSASTTGELSITKAGTSLTAFQATLVDFDNPINHPRIKILSPQRLDVVVQHFVVSVAEENTQLWDFVSARAELCDLTADCRIPGAELRTNQLAGIWSGGKSLALMVDNNRVLVSSPLGQKQLSIAYNYRIRTLPKEYLPSCSMIYEAPCIGATTAVLYEAVAGKPPTIDSADVKQVRDVKNELKISCPRTLSGANFSCAVAFESFLGPFPLSDAKTVTVCTWRNWDGNGYPQNCANQGKLKPSFSQTRLMQSGSTSQFNIPAKAYSSYKTLDVIVSAPSVRFDSEEFSKPAKPAKQLKPMTVRVQTIGEVVFGETHTYRISTTPALSGTCKVYRARSGMLYLVATNTLTRGSATGSHRWLWDTPGSTALSLTVDCSNSTHSGTGYAIVRGFR